MTRHKLGKSLAKVSLFLMMMYIFFWDNKIIIYSKLTFYISVALAVCSVLVEGRKTYRLSYTNAKVMLLVVLTAFVGLFFNIESINGSEWCMSIFLLMLYLVFLESEPDAASFAIKMIIIFSAIHVSGVLLQVVDPDRVELINSAMLKSGAYSFNTSLIEYNYNSGFSGYNMCAAFYSSVFSGAMLVLFIDNTRNKGNVIKSVIYLLLVIVGFYAVIATQKRGIVLASIGAYMVILLTLMKERRGTAIKVLFVLFIFYLVGIYLLNNTESGQMIMDRFTDKENFMSNRDIIYKKVYKGIAENPIFGNGTGSATDLLRGGDVHNIYLQILYDGGAVLFIAFLILFLNALRTTFTNIVNSTNRIDTLQKTFFLYIQVVFLIYGMTGNPLYDIFLFSIYILAIGFAGNKYITESTVNY